VRFSIRKVVECTQTMLVRPVASGVNRKGCTAALRGVGMARTVVTPDWRDGSGNDLFGPTQRMTLSVVDRESAEFPGQIPAVCPDASIAPGAPIAVLDAASGALLARGAVGACNGYSTTTGSLCVPGIGCLPSLSSPEYSAQLFGTVPVLPAYTFRIGTHDVEVSLADAQRSNWRLRLNVSNS
jgi:hypothetical protein